MEYRMFHHILHFTALKQTPQMYRGRSFCPLTVPAHHRFLKEVNISTNRGNNMQGFNIRVGLGYDGQLITDFYANHIPCNQIRTAFLETLPVPIPSKVMTGPTKHGVFKTRTAFDLTRIHPGKLHLVFEDALNVSMDTLVNDLDALIRLDTIALYVEEPDPKIGAITGSLITE
jgi:hypothetical protein